MADKSFISRAKSGICINVINLFNKQIIAVPRMKPSRNDSIAKLPVILFLLMGVRRLRLQPTGNLRFKFVVDRPQM
jgi:hypothetical protein